MGGSQALYWRVPKVRPDAIIDTIVRARRHH
jgi:hypothetical protein